MTENPTDRVQNWQTSCNLAGALLEKSGGFRISPEIYLHWTVVLDILLLDGLRCVNSSGISWQNFLA